MNNKELIIKFINIFKKKNHLINLVKELEKGESGILQTLFIYEENYHKNLTPGDLCETQQLTSGRVASTLKNLEKKAYIKRITDDVDKRKIIIKLTEKGKKIAKKIINDISTSIDKMINKLGEHDSQEFIRILNRLYE